MFRTTKLLAALAIAVAAAGGAPFATGQDVKHYRFAYDQPKGTGYAIAADIFTDKLKEFSKGTMIIDQYPGATRPGAAGSAADESR